MSEVGTITITATSREFTEVEQYLMTLDSGITSMKDVEDGTSIAVDGWLEFTDNKKDGEVELIAIIDKNGKAYSAQSATFKRALKNIDGIMHGKPYAIIKKSGVTKAGRPFIDCSLDVESVR